MKRLVLFLMASILMLAGCSGRLEFDPRPDAGKGVTPGGGGGLGAGSGGMQGGGATGGTMMAMGSGGDSGGYGGSGSGGNTGTGGNAPAPRPDAGAVTDAGAPAPEVAAATDGAAAADGVASLCPTGFNVFTEIFTPKCGGCHGATSPTKNLDMVTAGLGARTINKVSTCNNKPLISGTLVGNKPTGLFFEKLAGPVTGCGVRMPAGGAPALSAVEMACVEDWAVGAINKALGN